jgi:primosomal protein N'
MAGAICPSCGKQTVFANSTGKACTKCNFKMVVPKANGKGGPGKKCLHCGKMQVYNKKCSNCGATYSYE